MSSVSVTCSTRTGEETTKVRVIPDWLLLGMPAGRPVSETLVEIAGGRLIQLAAKLTAAVASMRPAPNLWLKWKPAELSLQSLSVEEIFCAERIRISFTSRQPRA